MAVGKSKTIIKGKKGAKKRIADPFVLKEWYDIVAPPYFSKGVIGKTLVNRTHGTKTSIDSLKGRVLEMSLGDLNDDAEDISFRKFQLRIDEVQDGKCLTNFHGMGFTSDKMKSMVKKWQTLIEANADLKTTDGYILRLFCIAFTKRRPNQRKQTCYAQTSKVKQIRKKMIDVMRKEVVTCELKEIVSKLVPDSIGREIEKQCRMIFPLQNVYIRKVKVLKKPKYDISKLVDMYAVSEEMGVLVTRGPEQWIEPVPSESV